MLKKIAIHHRPGSFSDQWINYCLEKDIPFMLVDCHKNDILDQLEGCAGLMWHWDLTDYKSHLLSRQLSYSLELKGIKIFPDSNTSWHYDDKVGQKYLLEAIEAPLVKSYVFYSAKEALKWVNSTTFPKVFKLRGGAGSSNVRLITDKHQAFKIIRKAFGRGFPHKNRVHTLKERIWVLKRDKNTAAIKNIMKGIGRFFFPKPTDKFFPIQKGYVYFQDFIPGNTYDTRIVIIGERCFGARRYCRTGDFRASGSGVFTYNPDLINTKMIKIAFDVAKKLKSQSLAFDFITDKEEPKIVEISYCFANDCCSEAPGYWDPELRWHHGKINLQDYMIKDFIDSFAQPASHPEKIRKLAVHG